MTATKSGKILIDGQPVKTYPNGRGYLTFKHKGKTYRVHRVVAEQHCKKPDGAAFVDHKNGKKTHNHASNLEWVTRKENARRAGKAGKLSFSKRPRKVTNGKKVFSSICQAAKAFDISPGTIASVLQGKSKTAAGQRWQYA